MIFNDVIKHLLSSGTVPTHVVFLNYVVCVNTLNQVFGIWTIFPAPLTQVKLGLQMEAWFKPSNPFPNFLPRDDIQHFPRPYWNILPFTIMSWKKQYASDPKVLFSIFSKKTTWFKPSSLFFNFLNKGMALSNQASSPK